MLTYAIVCSLVCNGLAEGPGELCQLHTAQLTSGGNGGGSKGIPQLLLKVAQLGKGPSEVAQYLCKNSTPFAGTNRVQRGGCGGVGGLPRACAGQHTNYWNQQGAKGFGGGGEGVP